MLRLPKLQLAAPPTLPAAARLLAREGPAALALAGGTDLIPKLKRRQLSGRLLVDLSRVRGFCGVAKDGGRVVIGAGTRLEELSRSSLLRPFTALQEAAACVATPQIRACATLGGNLALDTRCAFYDQSGAWRSAQGFCLKTDPRAPCRAAPGADRCLALSSGDLAPALIALGARLRLVGPRGRREIAVEELYRDQGASALRLEPGELIAAAELDSPAPRSAYLKLRRRGSFDFPALGVACAVTLEAGEVRRCRVALTALSSAPFLAAGAGRLMEGKRPTAESVAAAAAAAGRAARPVENADFPASYRRRMAEVFVLDGLSRLTGISKGESS